MTYNKFLATEISGLREPTYPSGAANKKYVDSISSNISTSYYNSESDLTTALNDNYAGSGNINRTLLNTISSNLDTRIDNLFNWSSNALIKYGASSHSHDSLYYTESESRGNFYPSSLGKSLMNFSANKSLYADSSNVRYRFVASSISLSRYNQYVGHSGNTSTHITTSFSSNVYASFKHSANAKNLYPASSLINRALIDSISSNIDIRVDNLFNWSSNARNIYYYSSLGHFFTGSGEKLTTAYTHSQDNTQAHTDYLLNNADDTTAGILTAKSFSGPLSGTRVSGGVIRLTTISGITRNITYDNLVDLTDGGETSLHTHTGMTTDVAWSGASGYYSFSSNTKQDITDLFNTSSAQDLRLDSIFGYSSNAKNLYANSSNINRNLLNSISGNLDTRLDSIFSYSSNAKSLYLASSSFKRNNWNSSYWDNSGLSWGNSLSAWKPVKSGAGILSRLTIDSDKDWNDKNISNVNSISSQAYSGGVYYTTTADPTNDRQLASKAYVDAQILANAFSEESAQDAIGNYVGTGLAYDDAQGIIRIKSYIASTSATARFADSSNIRTRFPASSLVNRNLINSISSNIDTRVDSLFNWSSNKSWYANSANVRFRFVESGGTKWVGLTDGNATTLHTHTGLSSAPAGTMTDDIGGAGYAYGISGLLFLSSQRISGGTIKGTSLTIGDVSNTEFGYLNGVTSAIQTQLDGKEPSIAGSGVKWYAAYKHSANTGLHSFNVINYITSANAISRFAGSANINRELVNSISSNLDTRIDSIFGFSSNAINLYYKSSLGHFYTGSGAKLASAYKSASTGVFAIASHTHSSTDVAWSGAYQFTAVSSMVKTLDTWYDVSSSKLSQAYKSASTGVFPSEIEFTTHTGDTNIHTTATDEAKWNDISTSGVKYTWAYASMIASGNEIYAAYKHSTNASWHQNTSGSLHNLWNWSSNKSWYAESSNVRLRFPASSTATGRFADSSNIRARFQASALSYQSYKHSANHAIHDTFTLNIGMVRLSANQNIRVGGFQMASSQNLYVWKASCCDSGGRSQGDLWIQVGSGQRGVLNGGKFTNIYKTSCNRIQYGYADHPLASYTTAKNGTNVVVRMMWSGTGVTPGGWVHGCNGKYGSSFCTLSMYP